MINHNINYKSLNSLLMQELNAAKAKSQKANIADEIRPPEPATNLAAEKTLEKKAYLDCCLSGS